MSKIPLPEGEFRVKMIGAVGGLRGTISDWWCERGYPKGVTINKRVRLFLGITRLQRSTVAKTDYEDTEFTTLLVFIEYKSALRSNYFTGPTSRSFPLFCVVFSHAIAIVTVYTSGLLGGR